MPVCSSVYSTATPHHLPIKQNLKSKQSKNSISKKYDIDINYKLSSDDAFACLCTAINFDIEAVLQVFGVVESRHSFERKK
ncbi:hypothetical protein RDI58_000833 [Solanum bulbocastanum]|uniref:Uncharacterized protein n=1 Tax=Solanum bulbocastanum TaxID=147425 RepID=A0AAN8U403_SOLBU